MENHDFPMGGFPLDYDSLCRLLTVKHTVAFVGGVDDVPARKEDGEKTLFLSGGTFTTVLRRALEEGTLDAYKERCMAAEFLLLEGVHYLGHKAATQEVFCDILKVRCANRKKTVLLAACPYEQLAGAFRDDLYALMGSGNVIHLKSDNLGGETE